MEDVICISRGKKSERRECKQSVSQHRTTTILFDFAATATNTEIAAVVPEKFNSIF